MTADRRRADPTPVPPRLNPHARSVTERLHRIRPGVGTLVETPVDALFLLVAADAGAAFLDAHAAGFRAGERGGNAELLVGVDPQRARRDRGADAPGPFVVARPNAAGSVSYTHLTLPTIYSV